MSRNLQCPVNPWPFILLTKICKVSLQMPYYLLISKKMRGLGLTVLTAGEFQSCQFGQKRKDTCEGMQTMPGFFT